MPTGMEFYDRNGNVVHTMTDRLFKKIGTITVGTTAGSITVAQYADSRNVPAWYYEPVAGDNSLSNYVPTVSVSGSVLNYNPQTFRGMAPVKFINLVYGYF